MQMLELENYGTVEMSSTEMVAVDGGNIPWGKLLKWAGEQIVSWGIGKALDATIDQASSGGGGGNTHMDSMNAAGDPS